MSFPLVVTSIFVVSSFPNISYTSSRRVFITPFAVSL